MRLPASQVFLPKDQCLYYKQVYDFCAQLEKALLRSQLPAIKIQNTTFSFLFSRGFLFTLLSMIDHQRKRKK